MFRGKLKVNTYSIKDRKSFQPAHTKTDFSKQLKQRKECMLF